ncbi:hypothetical protein ES705_32319 [subsurface metagenome]
MAKPDKPLLSLGARGTIADSLTFQHRGRATIARKKPIPENPRSEAQLAQRQVYRDAISAWHALTAEAKEAWRGVCPGLSPYHCFMRSELKYVPPLPPELTLYEYYNTGDTTLFSAHDTNWAAQTFTPSIPHKITRVKLKLFRNLASAEYTIKITTTDGDGYPTDNVLCSMIFDSEPITTESPGEWYEFIFDEPAILTEDTVYAIIIHGIPGLPNPKVYWRADPSAPTYDRGCVYYSINSGESWTRYLYDDLMFEDWGYPLEQ